MWFRMGIILVMQEQNIKICNMVLSMLFDGLSEAL